MKLAELASAGPVVASILAANSGAINDAEWQERLMATTGSLSANERTFVDDY